MTDTQVYINYISGYRKLNPVILKFEINCEILDYYKKFKFFFHLFIGKQMLIKLWTNYFSIKFTIFFDLRTSVFHCDDFSKTKCNSL